MSLRLVVGALLLIFGLQWLRKAILRASGCKALHDEDAIFAQELEEAAQRGARGARRARLVRASRSASRASSWKGSRSRSSCSPSAARRAASRSRRSARAPRVLLVGARRGRAARRWRRVPENTMKFAVGVMLTTFGIFWAREGAGGSGRASDAALPVVLVFVIALSLAFVALLRRRRAPGARVRYAEAIRPLLVGLRRRRRLAGRGRGVASRSVPTRASSPPTWTRGGSCRSPSSRSFGRRCCGRRLAGDPAGADVGRRVPRLGHARDLDDVAGVRRVDELPAADVDPDVAQPVEEDEVARLELSRDGNAGVPLRTAVVRQRTPSARRHRRRGRSSRNRTGSSRPRRTATPR